MRPELRLKMFAALAVPALAVARSASAIPIITPLASFNGLGAIAPVADLTFDAAGNLYGTTESGAGGYGSVFELSGQAHQTLTMLAAFNKSNGFSPQAGLTADAAGNLYGTTAYGGDLTQASGSGGGTVFELSGSDHKTLSTLVKFTLAGGDQPVAGLTPDAAGNLYGTTTQGGDLTQNGGFGGGTLFELSGANHQTLTTLVNFTTAGGYLPRGRLMIDPAGNLYGTTDEGGAFNYGTVFELTGPNHQTVTTLVNFNKSNGAYPFSGLTADAAGNLFGTTQNGGANNVGTVFELSGPDHETVTTLQSFNGSNGLQADSSLTVDAAGNLFGTSGSGGDLTLNRGLGDGTIFELSGPNHQSFTTLITFNGSNGVYPFASLIPDGFGNLYGTTEYGGSGSDGTVFELTGTGFVVPEPTTLSLLTLAPLALLHRRHRTSKPHHLPTGPFSPA